MSIKAVNTDPKVDFKNSFNQNHDAYNDVDWCFITGVFSKGKDEYQNYGYDMNDGSKTTQDKID